MTTDTQQTAVSVQATQRYMNDIARSSKLIEMAFTDGFDQGARTALTMVGNKIAQDAVAEPNETAKAALSHVAAFIGAVATGGTIHGTPSTNSGSRDPGSHTGGDQHERLSIAKDAAKKEAQKKAKA